MNCVEDEDKEINYMCPIQAQVTEFASIFVNAVKSTMRTSKGGVV